MRHFQANGKKLLWLILGGLSLVACTPTEKYKDFDVKGYKSLTKAVETVNKLRPLEVVKLANEQQNDLLEILKDDISQELKDKAFRLFLDNLRLYRKFMYVQVSKEIMLDTNMDPDLFEGKIAVVDGLTFQPVMYHPANERYQLADKIIIISPQTSLFEYISTNTGYYTPSISMSYLQKVFSQYLSQPLQEYLAIRAQEEKDLNNQTLYQLDDVSVAPDKLLNWILGWENYLENNPHTFYFDEIRKSMLSYAITYCGLDYFVNEGEKIPQAYRKNIENYLATMDKNIFGYQQIQEAYNWLMANHFVRLKRENELNLPNDIVVGGYIERETR